MPLCPYCTPTHPCQQCVARAREQILKEDNEKRLDEQKRMHREYHSRECPVCKGNGRIYDRT